MKENDGLAHVPGKDLYTPLEDLKYLEAGIPTSLTYGTVKGSYHPQHVIEAAFRIQKHLEASRPVDAALKSPPECEVDEFSSYRLLESLKILLDCSEKHIFGNECQSVRDHARNLIEEMENPKRRRYAAGPQAAPPGSALDVDMEETVIINNRGEQIEDPTYRVTHVYAVTLPIEQSSMDLKNDNS